jgi:hypothetical protein
VVGVVLILLAIFVIGPIAVFVGGAIWSLITGWLASEDADLRASGVDVQESASG